MGYPKGLGLAPGKFYVRRDGAAPDMGQTVMCARLVFCGVVYVVDDEDVDGGAGGFEFEV